jgi:hypothetical protein
LATYLVYGKARGGLELYRNKGPCEADSGGRGGFTKCHDLLPEKKQFLIIPSKYPPGISKKTPPKRGVQVVSPFLEKPPKQKREKKKKSIE